MKIITFIITLLLSSAVNSAALVHPTIMKIEHSGLIGEKGTLKSIPYNLAVEYVNKTSVWPSNKQQLSKLSVAVDGIDMKISNKLYSNLTGVSISDIRISYIQRWGEMNSIDVFIPYGNSQPCKNHDNGNTNYLKSKRILVFSVSGDFRKTIEMHACEHSQSK
ncbi:hypothetical protein JK628_02075 [Shewanella sp. KX20019]|uniref:hypothetical protein n=1 Tax=Shewanella sp. KX20019 TaxID=2803864 RepID=UPI001927D381|nr:hypothetical protein [Shewanella sp. KX20019]QQX80687.1 hypothetical protein JK628_02075 [Shewanella sp. KX20019]